MADVGLRSERSLAKAAERLGFRGLRRRKEEDDDKERNEERKKLKAIRV